MIKKLIFLFAFLMLLMGYVEAQSSEIQIKIPPDYAQITTIRQLLLPFKGNPVFVDLWATWCEPCKDEFKFKEPLNKELKKRGIKMVYVSIDQQPQDSLWRAQLDSLKLYGTNVRATKALDDELAILIWGVAGGHSIPHYLLFDRSGKALLTDALPPSSGAKLYQQLDKILNKQ